MISIENSIRLLPILFVSFVLTAATNLSAQSNQSQQKTNVQSTNAQSTNAKPNSPLNQRKNSIPLRRSNQESTTDPNATSTSNPLYSLGSSLGSLLAIVGVLFVVLMFLRKYQPTRFRTLPDECFQLLGHKPFTGNLQIHLARCGEKLLVIAVGTNQLQTLTEITDPAEVERLTQLCSVDQTNNGNLFSNSSVNRARTDQVLNQVANQGVNQVANQGVNQSTHPSKVSSGGRS